MLFTGTTRFLGMVIGLIVIIGLVSFTVRSCDKRRNQAAQAKVERSQADAASNSAAEAINTVSAAGEREAASEGQSREAERDIRSAPGASDPVNPAARDSGLRALCERKIYADHPRCRRP